MSAINDHTTAARESFMRARTELLSERQALSERSSDAQRKMQEYTLQLNEAKRAGRLFVQ
jgi:hypothetical protein